MTEEAARSIRPSFFCLRFFCLSFSFRPSVFARFVAAALPSRRDSYSPLRLCVILLLFSRRRVRFRRNGKLQTVNLTSEIIVVSGLPRSGTSLMMQMLESGGVEVITDSIRTADPDNPRGYFEFEKV